MRHIHLPSCPSTQSHLLGELETLLREDPHTIVTTASQTQGRGRRGRGWDFLGQALACSFTLKAATNPTLAVLGVGVTVCDFLEESLGKDVGIKWPNDLMFRGLKCGGIVANVVGPTLVVGLGLNLNGSSDKGDYPHSHLSDSYLDPQETALALYHYLLDHWPGEEAIVEKFHGRCVHLGREVTLWDDHFSVGGTFQGIDHGGGALLRVEGREKRFFVGHLKYH